MPKPKGMDKSIIRARKVVRTFAELEDKVINEDMIDAYRVIVATMHDKEAPAATRRAAANDIISIAQSLNKDALKKLEDFEQRQLEQVIDDISEEQDEEVDEVGSVLSFKSYS